MSLDWKYPQPSYPVTAMSLCAYLIPSIAFPGSENHPGRDQEDGPGEHHNPLEEFLLWPPDLFAFTSAVLELTGAYTMAVCPPPGRTWPPSHVYQLFSPDSSTDPPSLTARELNFCDLIPEKNSGRETWSGLPSGNEGGDWQSFVRHLGHAWRVALGKVDEFNWLLQSLGETRAQRAKVIGNVPELIRQMWMGIVRYMTDEHHGNAFELWNDDYWPLLVNLLTLHAIADEAALFWGTRHMKSDPSPAVSAFALARLEDAGTLATVDESRCRILPKRHAPRVGMTLRSISSNLAFHVSSVKVRWSSTDFLEISETTLGERQDQELTTFSILLLPWPLDIETRSFEEVHPMPPPPRRSGTHCASRTSVDSYFNYVPRKIFKDPTYVKRLQCVLEQAARETKQIDLVVMPECSIGVDEVEILKRILGASPLNIKMFVVGVKEPAPSGECWGRNTVYCGMRCERSPRDAYGWTVKERDKHHRWQIDRWQAKNYQLGGVLHPGKVWWEAITLGRRKLDFINLGELLTVCPLICEDLARQEPIADLIRVVGPSLVVCILQDGPQNERRWSAKYSSVLADDPGCTVVTLTSAGLARRWKHHKEVLPPTIALWSDPRGTEEIQLEPGAAAVLLSVGVEHEHNPSADGRLNPIGTNTLFLGGVRQLMDDLHEVTLRGGNS